MNTTILWKTCGLVYRPMMIVRWDQWWMITVRLLAACQPRSPVEWYANYGLLFYGLCVSLWSTAIHAQVMTNFFDWSHTTSSKWSPQQHVIPHSHAILWTYLNIYFCSTCSSANTDWYYSQSQFNISLINCFGIHHHLKLYRIIRSFSYIYLLWSE